jgi:DNA-binding transcriptional MerR regulator
MSALVSDALTVHEAAATTGWSARMLRYLERVGLVVPPRTAGGYRLYGAPEVQRLRTLRELLATHKIALSDVAFAKRLRDDPQLSDSIAAWLESRPSKPVAVTGADWLAFEQEKCRRLLAAATAA